MSVLSVSSDVVRYAMALSQTTEGQAVILAAGGPVTALIVKWGLVGLNAVLTDWTGATISDADVEAALAAKGFRVVPFDKTRLFG